MSGPRALSRATKPNPADSVDQRDHGRVMRLNLRLGNEAVRHPRFFLSEHESPRSCDFLHVFRERYRAPGSTNVHADSRVSCAQRVATVTPEYRPRFSRCCPSRCAARLLDRTRLRPPRARRVATPPKPAERDQVRLPTAREGAAPDFAKVYSDY